MVNAMPMNGYSVHVKCKFRQGRSTRTCSAITGWKVPEATPMQRTPDADALISPLSNVNKLVLSGVS
jgi:hypothetical protein